MAKTGCFEICANVKVPQRGTKGTLGGRSMTLTELVEGTLLVVPVSAGGSQVTASDRLEVVIDDRFVLDTDRCEEEHRNHAGPVPATHAVEENATGRGADNR
jgi:hypothetical protein